MSAGPCSQVRCRGSLWSQVSSSGVAKGSASSPAVVGVAAVPLGGLPVLSPGSSRGRFLSFFLPSPSFLFCLLSDG